MRKLFLIPLLFLFASCEVEGDLLKSKNQPDINLDQQTLSREGVFIATSGIIVEGKAKIYKKDNISTLVLEGFNISSGPDLKVYLSKKDTPSEFVNLGSLHSPYEYVVPEQVKIEDYPFVLIHCQQYNHLFAVSNLK